MKRYVTFIAFLLLSPILVAQETVTSDYTKNSLTTLMLQYKTYQDENWAFEKGFLEVDLSPKYFSNNEIANRVISLENAKPVIENIAEEINQHKQETSFFKGITKGIASGIIGAKDFLEPTDTVGMLLRESLEKSSIASSILQQWTKKGGNGEFQTLKERSLDNLTSDNRKNQLDPNKINVFKKLLERNYILVFDFGEIERGETFADQQPQAASARTASTAVVVPVNTYIYRLDINPKVFSQVKAAFGSSRFQDIHIPIEYVGRYLTVAEAGSKITQEKRRSMSSLDQERLYQEFQFELAQNAYGEIIELAEMHIENFKTRTKVSSGYPSRKIEAEIGLKQNLKTDQRYLVYEYELDPTSDSIIAVKKGSLRAFKVVDNIDSLKYKDSSHRASRFYQTSGKPIKEGMFLVQENDFGVGVSAGFRTVTAFNVNLRIDYKFTRFLNQWWKGSPLIGTSVYGDIFTVPYRDANEELKTAIAIGFGLSSKVYFSRWVHFDPYIGYYAIEESSFWNIGLRYEYGLKHNLFLVPEIGFGTKGNPVVGGLSLKYEM